MGQSYYSLGQLLNDAMFEIPEWKEPFISMFLRPIGIGSLKSGRISTSSNPEWKTFEKESWYYPTIQSFEEWFTILLSKGFINLYFYNKIFSMSMLMPDLCEFMEKNKHDIPEFTASKRFLKHAVKNTVPPRYFPYLAIIMIIESESYSVNRIADLQERTRAKAEIETMNKIYHIAFSELYHIAKLKEVKIHLEKDTPVSSTDVYSYNGVPHNIKFFDSHGDPKSILILGDRGTGKTIGLQRTIWSAIQQKFTVLVFGKDERHEFRFATKPLSKRSNSNMYSILSNKQGEKPKGLPIHIYTDEPEYSFESHTKDFKGDWDNLEGVVIFENNIEELLDSFETWRKKNRSKKMILCINEAQNIASSTGNKKEWQIFKRVAKFFTNIRGFKLPVVLNSQFISKLKKDVRMSDEVYVSYISITSERESISKKTGIKDLNSFLGNQKLKKDKTFIQIIDGQMRWIRFLVPPCMPENSTVKMCSTQQ